MKRKTKKEYLLNGRVREQKGRREDKNSRKTSSMRDLRALIHAASIAE